MSRFVAGLEQAQSERQWTDIVGVLRVQGDGLERDYLLSWVERLGLADLLRRAIDEVAEREADGAP